MKRIVILILACVMALSFCACGLTEMKDSLFSSGSTAVTFTDCPIMNYPDVRGCVALTDGNRHAMIFEDADAAALSPDRKKAAVQYSDGRLAVYPAFPGKKGEKILSENCDGIRIGSEECAGLWHGIWL